MRKINSKFITKFISEAGSHIQNKDYFGFIELDKFAIYVIGDGIDKDIDLKSGKIAVTNIIKNFSEKPSMRKGFLQKLLRKANKELCERSKNQRLKASITIVVTNYVSVRYACVGNTRFCLYREGIIKTKSKDQSLTQQLVDKEKVQLDKIAKHEERNNLYCYLGQDEKLKPYISKKIKLKNGDTISLLTRGVWENIDASEIEDVFEEATEPEKVIDDVEDMLLSKQKDEVENYTLAVIFVDKIYANPKRKQKIKRIILMLIPIIIIIVVIGSMLYFKRKKRIEQTAEMNYLIENGNDYIKDENFIRAEEEYKKALSIAKKLKLEEKRDDLDKYHKATETIISGDECLQSEGYEEAMGKYLLAQQKIYYADNIGRAYIYKQMNKTNTYIKVLELLDEGDKELELDNLSSSKKDYLAARALATKIFFKEGKEEANEKLNILHQRELEKEKDQEKAEIKNNEEEEKGKQEQEEQKQKQEEEKQAQEEEAKEKFDIQMNILEISKKADMSYRSENYQDAKMYYTMVEEMYKEIEMWDLVSKVQEKLQIVENKIEEASSKKDKANKYEEDARNKFDEGNFNEAKILYMLAKDIYEEAELIDEVKKIEEKIQVLNALIENQINEE